LSASALPAKLWKHALHFDLKRKLVRYIRHYNTVPKTVKWMYFDPSRRITPPSAVAAD